MKCAQKLLCSKLAVYAAIFAALSSPLIAYPQPALALCSSYPNYLTNGNPTDAGQVMANFGCAALTQGATLDSATITNPTISTPTITGPVSVTGNATITGNTSITGNATIGGNVGISGTTTLAGPTTINGTTTFTGPTALSSGTTGLPLSTGVTGSLSAANGGKPSNRYTSFGGMTQTYYTSSSRTMGGYGGSWTITPHTTGNVRYTFIGNIGGPGSGQFSGMQLAMGTGSPPTSGSLAVGGVGQDTGFMPSFYGPATLIYESYGNALGVPLWFDVQANVQTSGYSMSIIPMTVIIEEF